MSFWGTSPLKSLLMASIPTILLIVIGVQNKYGINSHLYRFIAALGSFIYCIMEEYGWSGYLQQEFQFLTPFIKFLLIGFIWYSSHVSFFTKAELGDNLIFWACWFWDVGELAKLLN